MGEVTKSLLWEDECEQRGREEPKEVAKHPIK